MAESMFKQAPTTKSRKTWRMVVIGAAVPFAMLAAAPAVSAAEVAQVETVNSEQLPPLPVDPPAGLPDPQALLDLQQCLTDVQALLPAETPVPDLPAEAEQLPPLPGAPLPAVPDVGALNDICQQVLTVLQDQAPDLPVDPPAELPPAPLPGE